MRPTYETAADRSNERDAIDVVCKAWRCRAAKLPRHHSADFVLLGKDDSIKGWVEIKTRNFLKGTFPTYMIAVQKIADLTALATVSGVPAVLVVALKDAVLYHRIAPPYPLAMGGRKDRGDPLDQEPVFHIPFSSFEELPHEDTIH